jgi:hypothetical protein
MNESTRVSIGREQRKEKCIRNVEKYSSKIKNNAIISREMLFDSKSCCEQELMASVEVLKDVVRDVKEVYKFHSRFPLAVCFFFILLFLKFHAI